MADQRFRAGQQVTWKDASGQRQRGRVAQDQSERPEGAADATKEGVLVIIDGTPHVSIVPPAALANDDPSGRRKPRV